MSRIQIVATAVLASCFASPVLAQESSAPMQGTMNASAAQGETAAPRVLQYKAVPFVSVAAGFTYLQTDLTNTPGGTGSYQMGWYGIPQLHLTDKLSVIADFTNFYNWHAHETDNVHGFTGGPTYALPTFFGVSTFGFVEGGAVRNATAGRIEWDPAAVGGVGMNFKLTRHFALQVIPGEYVATQLPNGNWQSNYNAKAGIVFTMDRLKKIKL